MKTFRRPFIFLLILLNVVVLLGQIWPEEAPPFARSINILFLTASLVFLVSDMSHKR